MNKENLSGKKVFVTGADGFIGSHLIEHLVSMGADVRAMVYYNSWNEMGWLKDIDKSILDQVDIYKGDIRILLKESQMVFLIVNMCFIYRVSLLFPIVMRLQDHMLIPTYRVS